MGREIRHVPADWQHPKQPNGNYQPLMGNYAERKAEYDKEKAEWLKGNAYSYTTKSYIPFAEKNADPRYLATYGEDMDADIGTEPDPDDYMPEWSDEEKTHIQMYEDTSEGTPISPPMPDPESLARWLADNNASAFGSRKATYEQWLATCKRGYALGGVTDGTRFMTGVEYNGEKDNVS